MRPTFKRSVVDQLPDNVHLPGELLINNLKDIPAEWIKVLFVLYYYAERNEHRTNIKMSYYELKEKTGYDYETLHTILKHLDNLFGFYWPHQKPVGFEHPLTFYFFLHRPAYEKYEHQLHTYPKNKIKQAIQKRERWHPIKEKFNG